MSNDSLDNPPPHPVSIAWPVSFTINSGAVAAAAAEAEAEADVPRDAPHNKLPRDRQPSLCSTAGASEPIEIPHSPPDESVLSLGEGEQQQGGLGNAASGGGDAGGNCWSAAWYQQTVDCTTEPWMRRSEESPDRPRAKSGAPFHIQIWDERSARQVGEEAVLLEQDDNVQESTDDELPSREDNSSEDSIFEMDMDM